MTNRDDEDDPNSLMTASAHALALSPPRAPPHDSAHRTLLVGGNPSDYALARHHDNKHHNFEGIRHHLLPLLQESHFHLPRRIPHPHLPAALEWTDKMTRAMGTTLPIPWLNACRDSGGFRSVADMLVTVTAPTMAITNPSLAMGFAKLSRRCQEHVYGKHPMQVIHVIFPNEQEHEGLGISKPRGLLFFVHGGAWGSGLPWMYRLVALPFLKRGMMAAIVGYRTFPDANVNGQVEDLEEAALFLSQLHPDLCIRMPGSDNPGHIGTCLMGHSSGAHISLLMLVDRARRKIQTGTAFPLDFDTFIGLSGPYDISHHFDYEAARGVEELSPMKPVCGYSRQAFRQNSPALRWMHHLTDISETRYSIQDEFPRMLLVHGIEDATVPFTSTAEAARSLRSCGVSRLDQVYVAKIGHQDTVMELMTGGKTRNVVLDWLQQDFLDKSCEPPSSVSVASNSKL